MAKSRVALALSLAFAAACYGGFFLALGRIALASSRDSYLALVPAISLGLAWLGPKSGPPPAVAGPGGRPRALLLLGAALAFLAAWAAGTYAFDWDAKVCLDFCGWSFALVAAGLCALFLGPARTRTLAFPLSFLALLAPIPDAATRACERFLQHASADAAYGFFSLAGTPVFRLGDVGFRLPDINLEVAPQCSGLHSSLALLIVSLPAGFLFLRSPWLRFWLAAATVPLGIVRNGFRIFTIGELCVHIGPRMIDSYIHHTGGWIFFLLSLAPLFLLLHWFQRREAAAGDRPARRDPEMPAFALGAGRER